MHSFTTSAIYECIRKSFLRHASFELLWGSENHKWQARGRIFWFDFDVFIGIITRRKQNYLQLMILHSLFSFFYTVFDTQISTSQDKKLDARSKNLVASIMSINIEYKPERDSVFGVWWFQWRHHNQNKILASATPILLSWTFQETKIGVAEISTAKISSIVMGCD